MNKKIFGLCDTGASYTEAFSHFISRHEGGRFDVMAFTRPESFTEYLKTGAFDVLLISEAFAELLSDSRQQCSGIPENLTFILTDEVNTDGYDFPCIYRYQSTSRILSQVISAFDAANPGRSGRLKRGSGIIAVYSPIGRCGKTALALALADQLGISGRALYINLEEYCGHEELSKCDGHTGISDMIYKCSSGADITDGINIKNCGQYDVILGAGCPEDIRSADVRDIISILEALKVSGYGSMVLDISGNLKDLKALLDFTDTIYVPVPPDTVSKTKVSLWEEELAVSGFGHLSKKIIKTSAPQPGKETAHAVSLLGN